MGLLSRVKRLELIKPDAGYYEQAGRKYWEIYCKHSPDKNLNPDEPPAEYLRPPVMSYDDAIIFLEAGARVA